MESEGSHTARFFARQHAKRHLASVWAAHAGLAPGMAVLDLGSGPGFLAAQYAAVARVVYALDSTVAPVCPPANLVFLKQDAADAIILPEVPDLVMLTDMLHHLPPGVPATVLRRIRAAAGPASVVFITEYNPAGPGLVGAKTHRRMPCETLAALLATAGFAHAPFFDTADEHYAVRAWPA